jgi:hypothetical protein
MHSVNVLGLDVGFSARNETCALCLLNVDLERNGIGLVWWPERFLLENARGVFLRLSESHSNIGWVAIDAPLTPVRIALLPGVGRGVDKRFSKGAFSNPQRGPQPGSIRTPVQGWPLYEAGMVMAENIREARLGDYVPFEGFREKPSGGVVECIPKLTQALLVPQNVVRERQGTVGDHLFPLLFAKDGPHRSALDHALGGYELSEQVEDLIDQISSAPRRCHEELAAVVAAVQGVLLAIGSATIVGRAGDSEGYFALPHRRHWNPDWARAFDATARVDGVEAINLGCPFPEEP